MQHPAETVEVRARVAIFFRIEVRVLFADFAIQVNGFADQLFRFFQLHVVVGPDVAQVVAVARIVGIFLEQEFEMPRRAVYLF